MKKLMLMVALLAIIVGCSKQVKPPKITHLKDEQGNYLNFTAEGKNIVAAADSLEAIIQDLPDDSLEAWFSYMEQHNGNVPPWLGSKFKNRLQDLYNAILSGLNNSYDMKALPGEIDTVPGYLSLPYGICLENCKL